MIELGQDRIRIEAARFSPNDRQCRVELIRRRGRTLGLFRFVRITVRNPD